MKKLLQISFLLLITFIFLPSCIYDWGNQISGEGNVVSDIREISDFTSIEASGGLHVFISFGSEAGVEVVADENLQEVIQTVVKGNTLRVRPHINIRRADSKEIYVTVPYINRINVSSAARVQGQNILQVEDLEANISSAGKLSMEVVTDKLSLVLSSSGSARILGETDYLHVNVSSAGELNAKDLVAEEADANASSAGSASVLVTEKLKANASSAGSINYYGNPKTKNISSSSAGSVNSRTN